MASINTVAISGRLVRDPEEFGQRAGCSFTVAVDGYKNGDTSFIGCKAFCKDGGGLGGFLLDNAAKGARVMVSGEIKQETWGEGDNKKSKTLVIARGVELIDWKSDNVEGSEDPPF